MLVIRLMDSNAAIQTIVLSTFILFISRITDVYITSEYTTNNSNLSDEENDKNHSQWINTAGIRWQF